MTLTRITSDGISDGSIVNADLHSAANIAGTKLADDAITQTKIAAGAVGTTEIATGAISHTKLAANAVETDNIANGTIVNANINASAAIAGSKLADDSISLAKLVHGTSSNNGKFLRANNGADPTFESVITDLVNDTSPQLGGDLASNGNDILIADDDRIKIGSGNDLHIYHNQSNSVIREEGTGNLNIQTTGGNVEVLTNTTETSAKFISNGAVELYHDNSKKFATLTGGCQIANIANNAGLLLSGTGNNTSVMFTSTADSPDNGYRVSYHSVGTSYFGDEFLAIDKTDTTGSGGIVTICGFTPTGLHFPDSMKLHLGGTAATGDLQIFHDGANSGIINTTGGLYIRNSGLISIETNNGESAIKCVANAQVELYHNNNLKLQTESSGVSVQGNLTPQANNSYDLGSSSYRWANVYTNDLHLSNEGHTNDVDGTWGNWTIQEGESDLFLKNNRSGKKYKFNLTEVS